MKLGLHISNFTWDGGPHQLAPTLMQMAALAEDAGFDNLTVMDHLWQIQSIGPREWDMLEAYTVLGYLAAATKRVELSTMVTGVTYRSPGLLAKAVTTLDVLSGGRAWLGLGAAWNEEEAIGLGLGYAPTAIRFEMLEEALQICLQMWSEDDGPYTGRHYQLGSTLNVPQSLQRPHPRIMIGGGGEKKTLRLVAQYADACNLFGGPESKHKLEVLREHCEALGRDYDAIEKTATTRFDVGTTGENVPTILETMRELHELGFTSVHVSVTDVGKLTPLEIIGRDIIPVISAW
jgi:F420-dependent oxidoreductase-like protein